LVDAQAITQRLSTIVTVSVASIVSSTPASVYVTVILTLNIDVVVACADDLLILIEAPKPLAFTIAGVNELPHKLLVPHRDVNCFVVLIALPSDWFVPDSLPDTKSCILSQ
jgi:hypothetical protein